MFIMVFIMACTAFVLFVWFMVNL